MAQFMVEEKELVGGLVAMNFIFPHIGLLIIPLDVHIFQRAGPTTNQTSLFGWKDRATMGNPNI